MFEAALDVGLSLIDSYGVIVLFGVFVLEGALIGKLIPTRTLFVAVVLAAGTNLLDFAPVLVAAVLGATMGQLLLFILVRRLEVNPVEIDHIPIEEPHVDRAERWFDRYGPSAIAFSNVVPVARGSMTVPTAMTQVSGYKFSMYSFLGSTVYAGVLVVIASGIHELFT